MKEGVTVLLENKCCEMHGQARCASQDGCCCDVEYVSFDWNVFHGHLFNLQPVAIDLISHICSHLSLVPVPFINEAGEIERESPPGFDVGTYLSFLTVLLI